MCIRDRVTDGLKVPFLSALYSEGALFKKELIVSGRCCTIDASFQQSVSHSINNTDYLLLCSSTVLDTEYIMVTRQMKILL